MNDIAWNYVLSNRSELRRADNTIDSTQTGRTQTEARSDGGKAALSTGTTSADTVGAYAWVAPTEVPMPPPGWSPPLPAKPTRARFPKWVPVALAAVGIGLEYVRSSGPFGFLGVFCLVVAALAARCAVKTANEGSSLSRSVAAAVAIGSAVGMLWRSNATLRLLDVAAIVIALPLAASVSFSSVSFLVRTGLLTVLEPVGGFMNACALAVAGALRVMSRGRRILFRRSGEEHAKQAANAGRVLFGLVIAVPVVGALGLLLSSADAVFASFFRMPNIDLSGFDTLVVSSMLALLFALLFAAPIVSGSALRVSQPSAFQTFDSKSPIEVLVVLGSVNALFGLFCIAQVVGMGGARRHVLETSGLSYAEYARSGFFQLLVVAVITLGIIGAARAVAGNVALAHRGLRWCSAVTALLTLGITAVAMNRLSLYMRAYGLTVDRIVSQTGTITIAAIFVLVFVGIVASRPGRDLRGVTTTASIGIAALAVFGLHVVNPSAWSVRDGFARGGQTISATSADPFAVTGLRVRDTRGETRIELDDDNVAEYLSHTETNAGVVAQLCNERAGRDRSWHQWTFASAQASKALNDFCRRPNI